MPRKYDLSKGLGTGMARKAGEGIKRVKKTRGQRMRSIMDEINSTRGGTQNFKKVR